MKHESIKRLKVALEAFVRESCQIVSKLPLFYGGYVTAKLIEDEITGARWDITPDMRASIPTLLYHFIHNAGPLASSDLVIEALRDDPELSAKLAIPVEESEWLISEKHLRGDIWNAVLGPYLEKCWLKHRSFSFDQQIFDEVFEETVADIEAPGVETEVHLSPIMGVRMAGGPVELAPGLRLRPIKAKDVETWLSRSWLLAGEPLKTTDVYRLQCAVEATYHRTREYFSVGNLLDKMKSSEEETETIHKVLGALRLLTNRRMHIAFTQKSGRGLLERTLEIILPPTPQPTILPSQFVTVDQAAEERLIKTWKMLGDSSVAADIDLPFRRWYGAADRLNDADRLIDYWVGLESLFSPDSTQEVRFRVSLRIAAFLGESPDEWEAIYNEMRHSYDWRSKVVHGGSPREHKKLEKQGTLSASARKTREYLRASLLKLLDSDQPLSIKPGESEIKLLRRLGAS
jgi:hypothetical protein